MARKCQINAGQRRDYVSAKEGMNLINRTTEEMRTSIAKKIGLSKLLSSLLV